MRVWSLALLSGLRIQYRHELWCRSRRSPNHQKTVAVVEAGSCSSDSTPNPGTSICRGCVLKSKNNNEKKQPPINNKKIDNRKRARDANTWPQRTSGSPINIWPNIQQNCFLGKRRLKSQRHIITWAPEWVKKDEADKKIVDKNMGHRASPLRRAWPPSLETCWPISGFVGAHLAQTQKFHPRRISQREAHTEPKT